MKEGWDVKKVSEIVEDFHQGLNTAGQKIKFATEGYPIIQTRNLHEGQIDITKKIKFMSKADWDLYKNKYKPSLGDVFLTNIGTIGKTAVVTKEEDYLIHWNIFIFKFDHNKLFPFYLKYFLDSPSSFDYYNSFQKGGTVNFITKKMIANLDVPYPIIEEQKQIVAILDQAFTAIDQAKANIEKNIVNAKELFQSKLNDIFSQKGDGWEEKTLKEISIDFGRGKSKNRPRNDAKLFGGKYPFVQTGDIRNTGKILKTFSQTYNETGLAQSKLWKKGTICITIAANIAETAILDFDSCFPDSMIGLVVDTQKADSNYTYYALQFLKSRLQELGKGSAQDNINLGTFQKQYFPFPSIKKQKEIVIILDNINKQTVEVQSKYQRKLFGLEELKKSILQKAFAGELTQKEVVV
jgi:type I restriction enzyme S subunit